MRKTISVVCGALLCTVLFSCKTEGTKTKLNTYPEKYSYMMGVDIGDNLKSLGTPIDYDALAQGLGDALKNRPKLVTPAALDSIRQAFSTQMQEKQLGMMRERNAKEGEAFLADNAKKPGVKTLPDGLQYIVEKQGTGPTPKATDKVKVAYTGTFINGRVFDASEKHGGSATFQVNQVIKGWSEALQMMPVGSKYKLFIPANLAYGDQGQPPEIQPGSTLIFDVELLGIEK